MNIEVIAPSFSASSLLNETLLQAKSNLEGYGFNVFYSENLFETGDLGSGTVESRISDIHHAFKSEKTEVVMSVIGGHHSIQLLRYIDWETVRQSKATLCGFSDLTVLENSILTKTGKVSFYGPHFSSFAHPFFSSYIFQAFEQCVNSQGSFLLSPSDTWGSGVWWKKDEHYKIEKNAGFTVVEEGNAEGVIVGGEMSSLRLLQGTEFMPSFKKIVLFLELNSNYSVAEFDADLESLFYHYPINSIQALIFGRFPRETGLNIEILQKILNGKKFLRNIPILGGLDFGHTDPMFTFPIGGKATVVARKKAAKVLVHR